MVLWLVATTLVIVGLVSGIPVVAVVVADLSADLGDSRYVPDSRATMRK